MYDWRIFYMSPFVAQYDEHGVTKCLTALRTAPDKHSVQTVSNLYAISLSKYKQRR